jgi:site-specific DNA-methyltransferase (adenine-specific)
MPRTEFVLKVGDCVTEMERLPASSVDLVVTSPPYNLGIRYGKYNDCIPRREYLEWSQEWLQEIHRVLKDDGSFFLNVGACPSNPLLPHELLLSSSRHFVLQNTFHWIKSITIHTAGGTPVSAGHFKPIRSRHFVNDCHEYIFHLTKTGRTALDRLSIGVPYADKSNIGRWQHSGGRDRRCRGNTWFIPYRTIANRAKQRPHPASFPVELAEKCIKLHGCQTDRVMLDPFLGIGNAALASKRCGIRKFIGFDIDPTYMELAEKMISIPD